jgi:hypothetical protein
MSFFNFTLTIRLDPELQELLAGYHEETLAAIDNLKETIMATLDEVLADTTDEKTQITSLVAFTGGLQKQLADALAGETISPAAQAKIDQIFANVEDNKAAVVQAMNAGTAAAAVPVS